MSRPVCPSCGGTRDAMVNCYNFFHRDPKSVVVKIWPVGCGIPLHGERTIRVSDSNGLEFYANNVLAVMLEQRYPGVEWEGYEGYGLQPRRYGVWNQVSREAMADPAIANVIRRSLNAKLDRYLESFDGFRVTPWPASFEPFPRWTHFVQKVRAKIRAWTP